MTPIDQIRKALEADDTSDIGINEIAALLASHDALRDENAALKASHDAAVQRAAEMERERDSFRASMGEWAERFEASQANAATLLQRAKTAEARAAEMQERCARACEAEMVFPGNHPTDRAYNLGVRECAAAIRAIKE